jgi:hypothetical protein
MPLLVTVNLWVRYCCHSSSLDGYMQRNVEGVCNVLNVFRQ